MPRSWGNLDDRAAGKGVRRQGRDDGDTPASAADRLQDGAALSGRRGSEPVGRECVACGAERAMRPVAGPASAGSCEFRRRQLPHGGGALDQQIGRASCRERVCQYVYISVVAVSLKKQKNVQNSRMK